MTSFGAHVSAAGGISLAIDRALAMEAGCIQIFGSPPQSFKPPLHTSEQLQLFRDKLKPSGIGPVFLHAPYLINLATPKQDHLTISVRTLVLAMNLAGELGAEGVIFHAGSSLGAAFTSVKSQVTAALKEILAQTPSQTKLIIENSAGSGGTVGDTPGEIGEILQSVNSTRLYTCLDTQHAFAAGYDLSGNSGITKMLGDWEKYIGLEKLIVLHANDSKVPVGSRRDRHANIGEGMIGKPGFKLMKENTFLSKLPWIIEVPGFDDKGPDKANLDILKSL